MAEQIYVRPAREGVLVPFASHRGGSFIGVRIARAEDEEADVVASSPGGHRYVATGPQLVERTAYVQRRIQQGDLVEVAAPKTKTAAPKGDGAKESAT